MKTSRWVWTAVLGVTALWLAAGCGKPGGSSGGSGAGGTAVAGGTVPRIQERIKAETALSGADVKVADEGGVVTLRGNVSSIDQKERAETIVYEVEKEMKQQPGLFNYLMVEEGAQPPVPGPAGG